MDVVTPVEPSQETLNWADLMDKLLLASFEKNASAWTRQRAQPRAASPDNNPASPDVTVAVAA